MNLTIIIPMAGIGSRFTDYGFTIDKYLLPIGEETMIEKAIVTLISDLFNKVEYLASINFIFIINSNNIDAKIKELTRVCLKYDLYYTIKILDHLTEGPAATVYEARNLFDKIESNPLIISNSDQILNWSLSKFLNYAKNYDGCVLTYKPNYELKIGSVDKHSFIEVNIMSQNKITDISEKTVLSDTALVGVHYYKNAKIFLEAYEHMYKNNIRAPNNELYLSLTYKSMLELDYQISYYNLSNNEKFYPVGEPIDYFNYLQLIYKWDFISILSDFKLTDSIKIFKYANHYEIGSIYSNYLILSNEYILSFHGLRELDQCYKDHIKNYHRGWFIGDFTPSLVRTKDLEIGYLFHKKDEKWPFHYHKKSIEINILISGKMILNNNLIEKNTIFVIKQNQLTCPKFLEDCRVLCMKIPSIPGDKVIV